MCSLGTAATRGWWLTKGVGGGPRGLHCSDTAAQCRRPLMLEDGSSAEREPPRQSSRLQPRLPAPGLRQETVAAPVSSSGAVLTTPPASACCCGNRQQSCLRKPAVAVLGAVHHRHRLSCGSPPPAEWLRVHLGHFVAFITPQGREAVSPA